MSDDVLTVKLETLHADVQEIKKALNRLSEAITKLALVEQQQNQLTAALERAFKVISKLEDNVGKDIEDLDTRVTTIERSQPYLSEVSKWVDRALVALAGASVTLFAKLFGVF